MKHFYIRVNMKMPFCNMLEEIFYILSVISVKRDEIPCLAPLSYCRHVVSPVLVMSRVNHWPSFAQLHTQ